MKRFRITYTEGEILGIKTITAKDENDAIDLFLEEYPDVNILQIIQI